MRTKYIQDDAIPAYQLVSSLTFYLPNGLNFEDTMAVSNLVKAAVDMLEKDKHLTWFSR